MEEQVMRELEDIDDMEYDLTKKSDIVSTISFLFLLYHDHGTFLYIMGHNLWPN